MSEKEILEKCFKKSSNIVARQIADEFILVPISSKTSDIESIYTLNKVAAFIWDSIDGKRNTGQILKIVLENFKVGEKEALEDMEDLFLTLEQLGAICKI